MLFVLCALVAVHLLIAGGLTLLGMLAQLPAAMFGGAVSVSFFIAISIGLIKKAEWARITLIWMCYVGLIANAFQVTIAPWIVIPIWMLELGTLIIAHSSSVRVITQNASNAKTFIYTESDSKSQEPT